MIKNGLFHKDIGFPPGLADRVAGRKFKLGWTPHAMRACISDRYGVIDRPPMEVTVDPAQIIEAEVIAHVVCKLVVRLPYSDQFDIVVVMNPGVDGSARVKTVWLNVNSDAHSTLNRQAYTQP